MPKTVLILLITVMAVITLHAFKAYQRPVISGRVFPNDAADRILVVNGLDSVAGRPDRKGNFSLNVSPGSWKLIVEGKGEYKNRVMENVVAKEGAGSNIALITLYK